MSSVRGLGLRSQLVRVAGFLHPFVMLQDSGVVALGFFRQHLQKVQLEFQDFGFSREDRAAVLYS